jgi:hypothetical protein
MIVLLDHGKQNSLVVARRCATLSSIFGDGGVVPLLANEQCDQLESSARSVLNSHFNSSPPVIAVVMLQRTDAQR